MAPTAADAERFAHEWADAWNRRDLDAVMAHYSESITFTSPRVAAAAARGAGVGDASGRVRGAAALRAYFKEAVDNLKELSIQITVRARPDRRAAAGHARRSPIVG